MKKNKTLVALILFLVISINGLAQVVPPPPQQPPPVGLPIDNGVILLVVLGLVYGAYKIISSRKRLNV